MSAKSEEYEEARLGLFFLRGYAGARADGEKNAKVRAHYQLLAKRLDVIIRQTDRGSP